MDLLREMKLRESFEFRVELRFEVKTSPSPWSERTGFHLLVPLGFQFEGWFSTVYFVIVLTKPFIRKQVTNRWLRNVVSLCLQTPIVQLLSKDKLNHRYLKDCNNNYYLIVCVWVGRRVSHGRKIWLIGAFMVDFRDRSQKLKWWWLPLIFGVHRIIDTVTYC